MVSSIYELDAARQRRVGTYMWATRSRGLAKLSNRSCAVQAYASGRSTPTPVDCFGQSLEPSGFGKAREERVADRDYRQLSPTAGIGLPEVREWRVQDSTFRKRRSGGRGPSLVPGPHCFGRSQQGSVAPHHARLTRRGSITLIMQPVLKSTT